MMVAGSCMAIRRSKSFSMMIAALITGAARAGSLPETSPSRGAVRDHPGVSSIQSWNDTALGSALGVASPQFSPPSRKTIGGADRGAYQWRSTADAPQTAGLGYWDAPR